MALDLASLAAAATAFLAPYISRAGEKSAEKVGEKLPDFAGRVWNAIGARLRGRPAAEEAAAGLVSKPEETDRRTEFCLQLRKALEADPHFAESLADILAQAQKDAGQTVADTGTPPVANAGGAAAGTGGVPTGSSVPGDVVAGSKTTVFDQRDSTVPRQVNVVGHTGPESAKTKGEGG